ncbi:MAG: Sua5 family C-terminal domain-containing protein [Pseudoxanthomonas sp.]
MQAGQRWPAAGCRVGLLAARRPQIPKAAVPRLDFDPHPSRQAQQHYRRLRQADEPGLEVQVVVPPPDDNAAHAMRARLQRAAGPGHPDKTASAALAVAEPVS